MSKKTIGNTNKSKAEKKSISKNEIIKQVCNRCPNLKKTDVCEVLKQFQCVIEDNIMCGNETRFTNFFIITQVLRKARMIIDLNSKTKKIIPPKLTIRMKPGVALINAVPLYVNESNI